jgi:hypothetical protein
MKCAALHLRQMYSVYRTVEVWEVDIDQTTEQDIL